MLRPTIIVLTMCVAFGVLPLAAADNNNSAGQSEYAPGQRAKDNTRKDAKDFAPGQRMQNKDDTSKPGATEYVPGKQDHDSHKN